MSSSIDPERTALLAMDFQKDILSGSPLAPSDAESRARLDRAVQRTAGLLEAVRKAGVFVIHVRVAFRPGYPGTNPHSPMMRFMRARGALLEGAEGTAFDPRVSPSEGEPVVTKCGVSAFCGTDLDLLLRTRGIEALLLTGVVTHYVVAGTAREAADRGYRFLIPKDCVASATEARHEAALLDLSFLGEITDSEAVRAAL